MGRSSDAVVSRGRGLVVGRRSRRELVVVDLRVGNLVAVDQKDGKSLWHIPTNHTIKTAPITYIAGGHQYIAVAAGANILCFGLP